MAGNSFGKLFKFTTWGESHGPAIGVVIDGVPSLLEINEDYVQNFLDKRKPGNSKFTSQRKEPDKVKILSGIYKGKTTGTPICMMIENKDQRSKDYDNIVNSFRPGHADFTYMEKYGIRDPRGGGRSSARETASRVCAGSVAELILGDNIKISAHLVQIGDIPINRNDFDLSNIDKNDFFCGSKSTVKEWESYLSTIRKEGSSLGAIVEIIASGVPSGLGEPVYDKLDNDIASAIMSINAVKGVEIGAGFESVLLRGEENADEIRKGKIFSSNNAGGILGGISTGQDIVVRFAIKPTSSILIPKKSIDENGDELEVSTKGRHDPCVGIRAVSVGRAMLACVLADHKLRHKGIYQR